MRKEEELMWNIIVGLSDEEEEVAVAMTKYLEERMRELRTSFEKEIKQSEEERSIAAEMVKEMVKTIVKSFSKGEIRVMAEEMIGVIDDLERKGKISEKMSDMLCGIFYFMRKMK